MARFFASDVVFLIKLLSWVSSSKGIQQALGLEHRLRICSKKSSSSSLLWPFLSCNPTSSPVILSAGKDLEPRDPGHLSEYVYDKRSVNWEAYFRALKLVRNFTSAGCTLALVGAPFVGTATCIVCGAVFLAGAVGGLWNSFYGREANEHTDNVYLGHEYVHYFPYQSDGNSTLKQPELSYKPAGESLLVAEHKCTEVDCFSAYYSNFIHPEHESVVHTFHVQSNAKPVASDAITGARQDESSQKDSQPRYGERATDGPIVMEYTWYDKVLQTKMPWRTILDPPMLSAGLSAGRTSSKWVHTASICSMTMQGCERRRVF